MAKIITNKNGNKLYRLHTSFNGWLEVNKDDGHIYLMTVGKELCNRLDCFVSSYQLACLREAGLPETHAK